MKRSDIPDDHVVELARQWVYDTKSPGVVNALVDEGIPEKLALAKVQHLIQRGLLECGVSPYFAWPNND